jgi:hypothetical protein
MDISSILPEQSPLKKVTFVSKCFAMILFIALPFLGAYIGYQFAPTEIVEIEKTPTIAITSPSITNLSRFLFNYDEVSVGQTIEQFEILEKNERPYTKEISIRAKDVAGEKLEGRLTAFYTVYTNEYLLRFVPYTDSYSDIPYPQNIDLPSRFILTKVDTDTEAVIDQLCGYECTPVPKDTDKTRELFSREATIYARDIKYEVENVGVDSLGHKIISLHIED